MKKTRWSSAAFLVTVIAAVAVLPPLRSASTMPLQHASSASVPPVPLPAGRPNYVVSMIGGSIKATWVRLAEYAFATDGTVRETFWYWNQGTFTGDASLNKVSSTYVTHGCRFECLVRTPKGFEPSAPPKTLSGTYYFDIYGKAVVTWSGGQQEAWTIDTSSPTYARLILHHTNYNVLHGYGFGSTASFAVGATIDQVKAAGNLASYEYWYNSYGVSTARDTSTHFPLQNYLRCTTSPCLQGPEPQPEPVDRYHSYVAGMPTRDGRKNYWNHQLGSVTVAEGGGSCISPGGGHTDALLQIIDDTGTFQGWVGAEASFNARAYGNAVVAAFYYKRS